MLRLFLGLRLLGSCVGSPEHTVIDPTSYEDPTEPTELELPDITTDELLLEIRSPSILKELESTHGLVKTLPWVPLSTNVPNRPSTHWLSTHHFGYQKLSQHLNTRIDSITTSIDRDLVVELKDALAYPNGNVGRRFDTRWLNTNIGFFQLVGIINRIDRMDFYQFDNTKNCGEVRFIYRLAYKSNDSRSSRLPLTFSVVYKNPAENCRAVARRWVQQESSNQSTLDWLRAAPLNLEHLIFSKVEINAQIVRFPSGLETEFAGQALYLLRVYTFTTEAPKKLIEVPLENTPDVGRIKNNPKLKKELVQYISTHLEEIDNGVYLLPTKFLATEAISYSTLGINRSANKPFRAIFSFQEQEQLYHQSLTSKHRWINSASAVIDRLNNASCIGCHQASTTAGFHFLGEDDTDISGVTNRLALPFSAHYQNELTRRAKQITRLANASGYSSFRPHSLSPTSKTVGTNHTCLPQEYRNHFIESALWNCSENEVCQVLAKEESRDIQFGQCIPTRENLHAGNACRSGQITKSPKEGIEQFNVHAYADQFQSKQIYDLSDKNHFFTDSYNCRPTRIGVPLGRTYRKCTSNERHFQWDSSGIIPSEICAVVGGKKFDSCVEKDFHSCLDSVVARGMVDSCHKDDFCREDYICQAMPYQLKGVDSTRGKEIYDKGIGFCTPTYFVFQLRLDGHPVPQ
jgi:hypothetical protein